MLTLFSFLFSFHVCISLDVVAVLALCVVSSRSVSCLLRLFIVFEVDYSPHSTFHFSLKPLHDLSSLYSANCSAQLVVRTSILCLCHHSALNSTILAHCTERCPSVELPRPIGLCVLSSFAGQPTLQAFDDQLPTSSIEVSLILPLETASARVRTFVLLARLSGVR